MEKYNFEISLFRKIITPYALWNIASMGLQFSLKAPFLMPLASFQTKVIFYTAYFLGLEL
jgi:hypothetical protein